MNFLAALLGGAAEGIYKTGKDAQDEERTMRLRQMDSDLEMKRQEAIQEMRDRAKIAEEERATAAKNKPVNDFAAAVGKNLNSEVPAEAPPPVKKLSGLINADGVTGFRGDIATLKNNITNSAMSDEDKQGALASIDQQAQQSDQINSAMTPPTRPITQSEATDQAMQDLLKSGNGPAYAAGKPLVQDKTLSVADGAAIIDQRTGKVLFQNSGKSDRQQEHEGVLAKLQQDRFDQQEKLKRMELDPLGINGSANSKTSGSASEAIENGVNGEEFLKTVSKPVAEQVRALATGRMSFPTGQSLKSPYWQSVLTLVGQYDPSFDAINYSARAATRKDFTSGKSSQSVNALNTVMGHLDSLGEAANKLNNSSFPALNAASNYLESNIGDARVKKFDATKKAVVDELTRAWRGTGGAEADIKTWASTLDASNSPEQLHGVIGQMGELLESKIGALNDQYQKGMGTAAGGLNLMSPHASDVLLKIKKRAGMDASVRPGGQSGVLTYDPQTGTFH